MTENKSSLMDSLNSNLMKVFDMSENDVYKEPEDVQSTELTVNGEGDAAPDQVDVDLEKTRANISALLKKGNTALESAVSLATSSESPRAIEALSTLLKTLSDINSSLLDTHVKVETVKEKRRKKGESSEVPQTQNNVQNIAIFSGTTEEALELLNKQTKKP